MTSWSLEQVEAHIRPGMKATLTVALVSVTVDTGNNPANLEKFIGYVKDASARGADIVVFPEAALSGYMLPELWQAYSVAETIPGPSVNRLIAVAKQCNVYIVMGMIEADSDNVGLLYQSAAFVGPEGLVGVHRKNTIECWGTLELAKWGIGPGREILVWEIDRSWRIGIVLCYDLWVPEVPRVAVVKGADLIIVPSACPTAYTEGYVQMCTTRAMENQTGIAYVSLSGTYYGVTFAGTRMAVEATGVVTLPMEGASDTDGMSMATFAAENLYRGRMAMPELRDRNPAAYHALVETRPSSQIKPYTPSIAPK